MSSLNRVELIGNLGADPKCHVFEDGTMVANLSVATTEKWKSKSGEAKEATEWHRVSVFGKTAEHCKTYLLKGSKVYIAGKSKTRKYVKDGVDTYTTEVVVNGYDSKVIFLDGRKDGAPRQQGSAPVANSNGGYGSGPGPGEGDDDGIPF